MLTFKPDHNIWGAGSTIQETDDFLSRLEAIGDFPSRSRAEIEAARAKRHKEVAAQQAERQRARDREYTGPTVYDPPKVRAPSLAEVMRQRERDLEAGLPALDTLALRQYQNREAVRKEAVRKWDLAAAKDREASLHGSPEWRRRHKAGMDRARAWRRTDAQRLADQEQVTANKMAARAQRVLDDRARRRIDAWLKELWTEDDVALLKKGLTYGD